MTDDKSPFVCPVCNTQWLVSAYDQTWTCPKCRKTIENPDVKVPVIEMHELTTEQKIEKALSYYRKALDKAFDKYDKNPPLQLVDDTV